MPPTTRFAAACLLALASTAAAQAPVAPGPRVLSQPTKLWSSAGALWSPVDVSVGNRGTQVFAARWHNVPASHAMLLSSHDSDPAVPLWESSGPIEQPDHAASSAERDVHVTVTEEQAGGPNERIRRVHKSSSQGLDWVYTYPHLGAGHTRLGVSRDGGVIVVAIGNPTTGSNDVLVFEPAAALPVQVHSAPGGVLWGFDLAEEGGHALLAIDSRSYVIDLNSGSLHSVYDHTPDRLSELGLAISGDGSIVGCNVAGGMAIYEWDGTDYVRTWLRDVPGDAVVDVSADGSTMVYGMDFLYFDRRIITECVDIPSKSVTMTEDITAPGQYGNGVADIAVSAAGHVFATATWGDEFNLFPELRIYSKHQSTPIQTLDLPGSATSVDVSPDGRWIAAGSEATHTHVPGSGGQVDLFYMGRSDLTMAGVPSLGNTVTFEVFNRPGRSAFLLSSPNLVAPGIVFPSWGTLHLDPGTVSIMPMGVTGSSGSQTIDWPMPTSPVWIGTSHYFQGLTTDSVRWLSQDWLVVTFLP